MADFTTTAPGQIASSGDRKALFLKLFTGEVLQTYQTECVTLPRIRTRTISNGKSAQFIVTGRVSGSYHTPGTEINGQAVKNTEKIINVDDLFVVPSFHANIDEAMSQWDTRAPISKEHGQALARKMDSHNLQLLALAARASANISGTTYSGTVLAKGATVATSASVFLAAVEQAAQALDEKDVGPDGRTLILRPAQYYLLLADATPKNANKFVGGTGNVSTGEVGNYMGFTFVKSNRLPSTNISSETGTNNTYNGDFSDTVALAFVNEAIARVNLIGVKTETEYSVRHQGDLIVSKYASGAGILRPEGAVEITKTAP